MEEHRTTPKIVDDFSSSSTTEFELSLSTTTPSAVSFLNKIISDAVSTASTILEDSASTTETFESHSSSTDGILNTINSQIQKQLYFSTFDYVIFGIMLALSAIIGVYFGFISKIKQNTTTEYLLGGKTMSKFPVSASLIATHISGITLLGVPSEMYAYGTQYWAFVISAVSVALAMAYLYLPVFYELQLTSCFTYLEKRFDKSVRATASLVYALTCLIYIPIVIYVPALAFSQVTGINIHVITPVICVVCIFYTTVGGLRAVVWTDTLQFILMVGAILAVIALGLSSVGGFFEVWEIAERGGRLIFFNMDPNPLLRSSFWTVSIGLTTMWIANLAVSQGCVQRFLAVPDIKVAKNSLMIFTFGLIFIKSCSCFTGLLMYAKYESCDPYSSGQINKIDQILPFYVMDVAGKIPGLPGLFVAGIFSAALSTMSSLLNTLAGTIYEDFIRQHYPNSTEKTASSVMKGLVVVLGFLVLGLVFIVEKLGSVLHLAISLSGVTAGALLGMFTMGMVMPKANTKGIISGAVCSIAAIGTILIGAQANPKQPPLPLRTDGCASELMRNITVLAPTDAADLSEVPIIFRISFMYYSLVGIIIFVVVGYSVSLLTGGGDVNDQRLLAPFARNKKQYEKEEVLRRNNIQYAEIDLALKELQKATDEI